MTELTVTSEIHENNQISILQLVINFFKQNNWTFSQHETEPILRTTYQGESAELSCVVRTRENPSQFIFYSLCPVNIPEKKRFVIAEFLTRVNYDLTVGNFEMDFQDGEVRYKTFGINVESHPLSSQLIAQLIFVNLMTMDRYLPGLMSVIYANIPVQEAIRQIEQQANL